MCDTTSECVPTGAERSSAGWGGEREGEYVCVPACILGEKWCEITSVELQNE